MNDREQFEAWHAEKFGWLNAEIWPENGNYDDRFVQDRWEVWSAARATPAQPAPQWANDERTADEIVTALYRRFKDWSARGFGPDDVTWCEVKADLMSLIKASAQPSPSSVGDAIRALPDDSILQAFATAVGNENDGAKSCYVTPDEVIDFVRYHLAAALAEQGQGQQWISVKDRLPEVGKLVLVYSPPAPYDYPGDVNITFDCIDPNDDDHASWLNHNENYEHFCCVAKPEGSTGPSEKARYTHWCEIPAAPSIAQHGQKSEGA